MSYKKKQYPKINDLPELNRRHLAWRLDHRTFIGMVTAGHIARGQGTYGEMTVFEVFRDIAELTEHQAKIHASKVVNFSLKNKPCKS